MGLKRLFDQSGRQIALGALLGKGGEGNVFELSGAADLVAKIYHNSISPKTAAKLRSMATLVTPGLLKFAAWPCSTLHEVSQGPVVGILMQKVVGYKEVHTLYGPAQRRQVFPQADWAFLIQVAMNCAAAFDAIHSAGHVIGDVNQSNVLVSAKALVSLIDCDSFQIRANGNVFRCEVGVPQYTPPELQGKNFRDVERTTNHDRFGLAVLIFHLLFMGRHPFVGRFLGRGEMPVDRAIREHRFAFSRVASQHQMSSPPHSLSLAAVSSDLARLFETAFSHTSSQSNLRPSAAEWGRCLASFQTQLGKCRADPGHRIPAHLGECPWCQVMRGGGPNYFITVAAYTITGSTTVGTTFVLAIVWARIEHVAAPHCIYRRPLIPKGTKITSAPVPSHIPTRLPPYVPTLLPEKVRIPWSFLQKSVGWVGIGALALLVLAACGGAKPLIIIAALCCAVFGGWWCALECARLMSQKRENADWEDAWHRVQYEKAQRREQVAAWQHAVQQELDRREQVSRAAQTALNQAEGHWQQEAARYSATFSNLRMRFAELKRQYEGLTHEYSQEYRQLQQNVRMAQLNQFLQTRFISDHSITDIGPVRKAALLSYGIESAFDVESGAVSQIPGFGVKLTKKLIEWRGEMEQAFRFDPTAGIPQSEITALDSKYRRKKQDIETELAKGPETLRIQSQQAENHLSQLAVGIQRFVLQAAQGDANAAILRGLQS